MEEGTSATVQGLEVNAVHSPLAGPFTFRVPQGACLAVTGPSGSGKSLLLRLIADLDAGSGSVSVRGVDRALVPAPKWRSICPYVAATPGFWTATAADHFDERTRNSGRSLAVSMLFDESRFDASVALLSTGERQRIALSRALVLNPPALLLDEPTGPLDQEATHAVASILEERLSNGLSLVLVTHDGALVEQLATERRHMIDRKFV